MQGLVTAARRFVVDVATAWQRVYATSMGAALAFYTIFSLPPLLVLLITLAGLFVSSEAAHHLILGQLDTLFGTAGAKAVDALLASGSASGKTALAAIISSVTLLVGATSVFAELQTDLDRIWGAPRSLRPQGLWGLLRTRVLSFGLIFALGFLLVVSLAFSALLAAMSASYGHYFGNWLLTLRLVNFLVSSVSTAVVFSLVYKMLPSVPVKWRDAAIGGILTTVLYSGGKSLIGIYLGSSLIVSGYGAAGSLLIVILWIYYSAQIFLLGAVCTRVYRSPSQLTESGPETAGSAATAKQRRDRKSSRIR